MEKTETHTIPWKFGLVSTSCHPACKCREAKVTELVEAAKKLINGKDPSDATLIAIVRDAVSAIEGVKG